MPKKYGGFCVVCQAYRDDVTFRYTKSKQEIDEEEEEPKQKKKGKRRIAICQVHVNGSN